LICTLLLLVFISYFCDFFFETATAAPPAATTTSTPITMGTTGVDFSVFMREDPEKIKISLRSQGSFPANKVAAELFNGGGHLNAAGGESYISLADSIQKFEDALPNYKAFLE
jgi:nanoRNase/pAp phosphatase (c-di-AMP/oligoRNAs hydrolase)